MSYLRRDAQMLALGGMAAMAGAVGIGRFIYTPILPAMVSEIPLTAGEAGLIASANYLGYLIGALLVALPRLPGERRRWLIGGLLVNVVTTGAMAVPMDLFGLLALRFCGGVASAVVLVVASTLVVERLAVGGNVRLLATHFAGVGLGIAVSAVIAWGVTAAGGGWPAMWLGGAAATVVALVTVQFLIPATAVPTSGGQSDSGRKPAAEPAGFWRLVLAYGLFGFGYVITATFIVAIVRSNAAIADWEPLVWLMVGLSAIPSVAAWSALASRLGNFKAFTIACLVEAIGVAASVIWVDAIGLIVAAACLGGTFMGITALGLAAARQFRAGDPRQAVAVLTAAFGLGQILGPLVAGFGHDLLGSFTAPSLTAAAALLIAGGLVAGLSPAVAGNVRGGH